MIKTTTPVSYDPIDNTKQAVVYARITQSVRNDISETYTLSIREWVEIPYTEIVDVDDEMVEQEFINTLNVRNHTRTLTFAEVDQLTAYLDSEFEIAEQGSYRRKQYTILGHLIVNNSENVRNVSWELA
jgi:hypothetical protein